MRKGSTAILLLLLMGTAAGTAQEPAHAPQSANDVRNNDVRNLERSKFDAIQRKDNATLDALLDDALILVDENGSLLTKAAYLSDTQNPETHLLQIVPQTMTLQAFDDVALVSGIYVERGVRSGHPYQQRCRFIDTWMFKKGKWVCIAATATTAVS